MRSLPMANAQKRTFSLPPKQAKFIDAQVRTGAYASASEVVRAGLRALQERDAAGEQELKKEVVPVYDAMQADPARGITAEKVSAERGTRRDDLRPGLRVAGFERRITIAFHVDAETLVIDRILYGGRDIHRALRKPRARTPRGR